jgi:beta-glucosidase
VDWLDANGTVLRHELRHSGELIWLGDAVREASEVRLSCRFRADTAGTWRLGVGGFGRFTLALDKQVVLDETLTGEPHLPGESAIERELAVGDELDIVLTHFPQPGSPVVGLRLGAQRPRQSYDVELAEAIEEATTADVAIVVVGTTEAVESEGFDRRSLALPDRQDNLVRASARANPRTIVVVNSGGPVLLPWRDDVSALLLTWFGGQEMGAALADVLLGTREPGGRLPTTWLDTEAAALTTVPTDGVLEYTEGLHVGYRRDQPYAYPFGHGLGYTTWEYLDIASATVDSVSVRLRNTGSRAGKEVVQVYLSRPDSSVDRPARWLAGFAVVTADPGAEVTATVALPARVWQHWSVDEHAWATESGVFTVSVGSSVADLPRSAEISVA